MSSLEESAFPVQITLELSLQGGYLGLEPALLTISTCSANDGDTACVTESSLAAAVNAVATINVAGMKGLAAHLSDAPLTLQFSVDPEQPSKRTHSLRLPFSVFSVTIKSSVADGGMPALLDFWGYLDSYILDLSATWNSVIAQNVEEVDFDLWSETLHFAVSHGTLELTGKAGAVDAEGNVFENIVVTMEAGKEYTADHQGLHELVP